MTRLSDGRKKLTQRQHESLSSRTRRLAKDKCASYGVCEVAPRPFKCVYEIKCDNGRFNCNSCPYFITHVLGNDRALEVEFHEALSDRDPLKRHDLIDRADTFKTCELCSSKFQPNSNRQKRCESCRESGKREADRRRQREYRLNKRLEEIKSDQ